MFVLTVLGTLAVMWVVPAKQLGLATGVMQAIQAMLDGIGAGWLTAPFAVLMSAGLVAVFSTWYLGPGKALGVAAAQGDMPPIWRRRNRHGSPVGVLFIQAGIATALSLVFVLVPSVNAAYWILTAITTELIIVMYLFVFAAALKLRYSQPDTPRPYRVPGGKPGIWIVCGVAIAALVFSLFVGFLPPSVVGGMSPAVYVAHPDHGDGRPEPGGAARLLGAAEAGVGGAGRGRLSAGGGGRGRADGEPPAVGDDGAVAADTG